jgi:hypothetical protein
MAPVPTVDDDLTDRLRLHTRTVNNQPPNGNGLGLDLIAAADRIEQLEAQVAALVAIPDVIEGSGMYITVEFRERTYEAGHWQGMKDGMAAERRDVRARMAAEMLEAALTEDGDQ